MQAVVTKAGVAEWTSLHDHDAEQRQSNARCPGKAWEGDCTVWSLVQPPREQAYIL